MGFERMAGRTARRLADVLRVVSGALFLAPLACAGSAGLSAMSHEGLSHGARSSTEGPVEPLGEGAPPAFSHLDEGADGRADVALATEPPAPPEGDAGALAYEPGVPTTVAVRFDKAVHVVHANPGRKHVLVYLHGVCGDPVAFVPWAAALVDYATLVSVVGDVACPGGHRYKWSHDMASLDRRVRAAVDAIEAVRGEPLDHLDLTVAGYSQGALRAEALAAQFPDRYRHVVLMAGPMAPSATSVRGADRVVIMAGEKDRQAHLRAAAEDLAKAGTTVRFFEIPGARHGEYGPEAERIMSEMLAWLYPPR